jgi:uncharacterized protein YgfB (UPF0149 family)
MSDDVLEESEFEWLANLYNINGAINHPSELHGIMIGHIVGNTTLQDDEWLGLCLDHMGIEEFNVEKQPHVHADLCRFYQDTLKGIGEDSSAFQICLPDDSYVVAERAEALGAWVGGFLEGVAVTQTQALANLDEDLQEILRDLVEISQLDSRMDSSETSERDFFEVCEYVRIGVLNLYVEFHEPDAGASEEQATPTIH